jgi:hypothetical protein
MANYSYENINLLAVCSTSRKLAEEYYKATLREHLVEKLFMWDYELDGPYFKDSQALQAFRNFYGTLTEYAEARVELAAFIPKVQHLVLGDDLNDERRLGPIVSEFSGLKFLTIRSPTHVANLPGARFEWEARNCYFLHCQWRRLGRANPPYVEYKTQHEILAMVPPEKVYSIHLSYKDADTFDRRQPR